MNAYCMCVPIHEQQAIATTHQSESFFILELYMLCMSRDQCPCYRYCDLSVPGTRNGRSAEFTSLYCKSQYCCSGLEATRTMTVFSNAKVSETNYKLMSLIVQYFEPISMHARVFILTKHNLSAFVQPLLSCLESTALFSLWESV